MANCTTERWLPVVGAEGYYEVSDLGRVRSVTRVIITTTGHSRVYQGRILAPRPDEQERLRVAIRAPGMPKDMRISRLVLIAFRGPPPNGMEGCHGPLGLTDNSVTNLRWDTHSENGLDTTRHGTNHHRNQKYCPREHLLVKPNLVAALLTQGFRTCLACSWANSAIRGIHTWNEIRQECPYTLQQLADTYYAKIMGLTPTDSSVKLPRTHKERTHCKYKHQLQKPNLVPSALAKNKRQCLACQRTFSAKWNAAQRGESIDFQVVSDAYYREIMMCHSQ